MNEAGEKPSQEDIERMVQEISDMLLDLTDEQVVAMYKAMKETR